MKFIFPLLLLSVFSLSQNLYARATEKDLEILISKNQWNDVVQAGYEVLENDPQNAKAKFYTALALFQRGYFNSALIFLQKLTSEEWKNLPQGKDRRVEIAALFQKKVPLTLLPARLEEIDPNTSPNYLRDEINYAKGRSAFEKKRFKEAETYLRAVSPSSRFFGRSKYLLGSVAVIEKDYQQAKSEFSKIFDSSVLAQSTEFWKDIATQASDSWGLSLRVLLDADVMAETSRIGEMALLALARLAFSEKHYQTALDNYQRLSSSSEFYPEACLERIWVLLAMNRHEEAQQLGSLLSTDGNDFTSFEARVIRALVLTDAARAKDARKIIEDAEILFETALRQSDEYMAGGALQKLPEFLKTDFKRDFKLQSSLKYRDSINGEIESLRKEDLTLFPAYHHLAARLDPVLKRADRTVKTIRDDWVKKRRLDIDELIVQTKLILAETFLEDRESIRKEFKGVGIDSDKQQEHDQKLVEVLEAATSNVDQVLKKPLWIKPKLEFRQSELIWELARALLILDPKKFDKRADILIDRAVSIVKKIVRLGTSFEKHDEALFFLAYLEYETGKTNEGLSRFREFISLYPAHSYTPDAHRILADHYFDLNRFTEAQSHYQSVLKFLNSPVLGYALYKLGWCAYNKKDFAKSLLAFEKAVMWATEQGQNSLSLKVEGRKALIFLYAEIGDDRKANEYFSKFENREEWLSELGFELDRIGQYEKSQRLYSTLIALRPGYKENVRYQARILTGAYRLRNWNSALKAGQDLVHGYLSELQTEQPEESPAAEAEKALREAVMLQLFEIRKMTELRKSEEIVKRVVELDKLYLSAFGNWKSSAEPMYAHALFLAQQGDVKDASVYFSEHWKHFNSDLKESHKEEALRNAISTLDRTDRTDEEEDKLLRYCEEYVNLFPKSGHARNVALTASVIYLKRDRVDKGIRISHRLFEQDPNDEVGKKAYKNIKVALYEKKDWKKLLEWSSELLNKKAVSFNSYRTDLGTVQEESLFLLAEAAKNNKESAELFLQVADNPEMKRLKSKALYNAYIRLEKDGQKLRAMDVGERLEKAFPDLKELAEISVVRGAYYQSAGDYTRALPLLESFIQRESSKEVPNKETLDQAKQNVAVVKEALVPETKPKERVTPAAWQQLIVRKQKFINTPMVKEKNLAEKIRKSSEQLEINAKAFLDFAADEKTPLYFALEAYCVVPQLYDVFAKAILKESNIKELTDKEREILEQELRKISAPIAEKAQQLANNCINKVLESAEFGPEASSVNKIWGWEVDVRTANNVRVVSGHLEKFWPMYDRVEEKDSENELIRKHIDGNDDASSWYALGKQRLDRNETGLAKLTFVDAVARGQIDGNILNALACLTAVQNPNNVSITQLEEAADKGSNAAWLNLAYMCLKAKRLTPGIDALKKTIDLKLVNNLPPEVNQAVKELIND